MCVHINLHSIFLFPCLCAAGGVGKSALVVRFLTNK